MEFAWLILGGMATKKDVPLPETRILDHPNSLSLYERESRAAEAKLAAEKKKTKRESAKRSSRNK